MTIICNCYQIEIKINFDPTNFTLIGYYDSADSNLKNKNVGDGWEYFYVIMYSEKNSKRLGLNTPCPRVYNTVPTYNSKMLFLKIFHISVDGQLNNNTLYNFLRFWILVIK